jgi:large subunit ribosomal protein L13
MKTTNPAPAPQQWFIVDASDKVLGRMAVEIANVLRGRHKPTYVPHMRSLDHVIVINAAKVKLTGAKVEQKIYYRHTGYLGHLRQKTMKDVMIKNPAMVIEHAVKGMLPKNLTRDHTMKKLHVFADDKHDHEAQQPAPFPISL